jgi:FkbM family methyltransferase
MTDQAATEAAPPYGAYPPTPTQRMIIRLFHGTPLGYGRLRRSAFRRFQAEREGPVDAHLFGLKVRFHPHDNQTDLKGAVCGGCYNADETRWLARHLPRGGTFVDIGANMGFFSLFAAKRGAKLVAIEPLPAMFQRLKFNMALNGFTAALFNLAVGPAAGSARIALSGDLGGSSLAVEGEGLTVPVRTLFSVLAEAEVETIDVLKIDVEGYEDRVLGPFLDTAPETLWPRAIIIEHNAPERWEHDIIARLQSAGYRRRARNRGNTLLVRG